MKAVFDTNVLIAAFLTEGICAKLLSRARRRDFDLILCDGILANCKSPRLSFPRKRESSLFKNFWTPAFAGVTPFIEFCNCLILQEFKRVLKKKFATSPHETSEALIILSEAALEIHGRTDSITPICRDSDDDLILACARDAVADYVVTGDEDILVLKTYESISIVNPMEFEKLFPD